MKLNKAVQMQDLKYQHGSFTANFKHGRIDNKVNIRRTNAVWILLDRDYSRNNPFTAEAYNSFGLPQKTGSIPSLLISRPPVFNISEATINYMCDSK